MPILMYGSESWILNSTLLSKLESFQAELGKRILRLHHSSSNHGCRIVLHWPSMCARVLCSKLAFLLKLLQGVDSLSSQVFQSLAASDVESIQLVRQCRFLESCHGSNLTTNILLDPTSFSTQTIKKHITHQDYLRLSKEASLLPHLKYIMDVASEECSWLKVWDLALDRGPLSTSCVIALVKLLGLRAFSNNCPFGSCEPVTEHLGTHFLSTHTDLFAVNLEDCVLALKNNSNTIITYGQALLNSFV